MKHKMQREFYLKVKLIATLYCHCEVFTYENTYSLIMDVIKILQAEE